MNLFTHLRVWQILTGWIILFSYAEAAWAQCPQASFTLPDTVCIGEPVNIVNTSTGATRYEWDFCSGDLEKIPITTKVVDIPTMSAIALGVTTIKDGDNWYSFITDFGKSSIFRLDYGSDLTNTPTVTDLGNLGSLLYPDQIKIIKIENDWFGIVGDLVTTPASGRSIVRLYFGDKLTNIPQASYIKNLEGKLDIPRSLEIYADNGNYIAVIANHKSNTLTIVNFGNTIANNPEPEDIIQTSSVQNVPQGSGLMRISIMKYCDQWLGVAASFNNKLFKFEFGKSLYAVPRITEINDASPFGTLLTSIKLMSYKSEIVALVTQFDTKVIKFDFGNSLTSVPARKQIFDFRTTEVAGPEVVIDNSNIILFGTKYVDKQIVRVVYPNCAVSQNTSNLSNPAATLYNDSGNQTVTLAAFNATNDVTYFTDSVFVRPSVSSTFSTANQCVNQPVLFTSSANTTGNRGLSYAWNFGDGNVATGSSVQYTFTTSKSYDVSLTVTDVCGKTTTTTQSVQIYNPSIANFTPPASICSNQPVTFTDASVVVNDSIVKWEWDFGNNTISNDKNPTYAFTQAGIQTVSLKITGKSGCQTNIIKSVTIKEGAKVGFAAEQTCLGVQTRFKDETILGSGTSFVSRNWDFGDNTTATESNPIHTYAQAGTYLVKLTVQNNVGCSVTLTKSIIIRRLPKAAFSTALACAGEGTQFTDASTSADGAITQWEWNFGEPTSSTNVSTSANPIHIFEKPGTYQVKLKVTTTFGCADSVTQAITVLSAPKADFTFQSSCTNREVIFSDASQASGTSITNYYWDFGDNSTPSTEKSPKHTYTREGTYTVQLTVTSSTRCTNTIQKTIAAGGIVVTFSPDTALCADKTVTFQPQVVTPNDPVKSWQWDFGTLGKFTTEAPNVTIPASLTALTISLTVTTNSGCSTTTTKTITVRPSAIAQFSYQSAPSQPLQITFVNQSTGASQYTWDFGDNTQSTSASPVHTYARGGIYTITLTALHPNGCESVKSILMPLEVANINQVTIFPNPFTADQTVTLAFMLPRKQPVSLEIIDLTGRSLQKVVIENTIDGLNNPALSQVLPIISSLGKGMYVITLRYGNTLQLQKVIVQ